MKMRMRKGSAGGLGDAEYMDINSPGLQPGEN